jgi:hypothetical protein
MPLNASQLVIFIVIHQKNNGKCTLYSAYETLAVAPPGITRKLQCE